MTGTGKISSLGTLKAFFFGERACPGALFHVLNGAFDAPMIGEERAAMLFAGGIMVHGYQCGMLWGASLGAGAEAYRRFGKGPRAEAAAICAAKRLVTSFIAQNNHANCLEITEINKSTPAVKMVEYFLFRGGAVGCCRRAIRYASRAFNDVNEALAEEPTPTKAPEGPLSCATLIAQKMGASEIHATMAAGLAGGIGLYGGACGALGVAIWLSALKSLKEGAKKIDFKNPQGMALIERFLKCSDYEFECGDIVGRKFESVSDHARHLREGGCAKIIETLAAA